MFLSHSHTHSYTHTNTHTHIGRQAGRQTDRPTGRQAGRQADRQTDTHTPNYLIPTDNNNNRLQLQSRLRGGKGAGTNAPAADGTIRVPGDVEDLDEAIEMIPGAGSTLEFDCKQHVLDDCAIVRWGMHLNIVGAAQGGGTGARNAVWGNWTLLQRTRGSFAHLNLALHSYTSRMALLDIRGGPWALAHCDARCIGGLAVELLLRAKLIMTRCGVGGIDTHFMRAQDAVVCRMDACADLEDCVLEMAGVISGYGIHLMEDARASLRNCSLLDNAIGCVVEGVRVTIIYIIYILIMCVFVCMCVYVCVCVCIYLYVYLSVCLSSYLSIYPSIYLSIYVYARAHTQVRR